MSGLLSSSRLVVTNPDFNCCLQAKSLVEARHHPIHRPGRLVGKPEVTGDFPDRRGFGPCRIGLLSTLQFRFLCGLTCFPAGPLTCGLRRGVHLCLRLLQRVLEPQIFLDLPHPRFLAILPSTSSGVPLKLSGAHNAAFSSSLFLVGITLTRVLSLSIRATVNITVRSPRSSISSMNIRPPVRN
jgi:hypothetical protein